MESAVSSGCTLLNLACTDKPDSAYMPGGYYYIVGDSSSGKTWLTLGALAEAANNPKFDNYDLIYDDVEGGALMDVAHYFGKRLAKRLIPPNVSKKGRPINSDTIESFYHHAQCAIERKKPFIYILDSQDSLTSSSSVSKFDEQRKAMVEGKEAAGSYGDGKAKYHSEHIRILLAGLRKTKSILIIIGQTRDNLGFGFEKKTRSGGKSLRFYANLEIWTSVKGKLKKRIGGKNRTVGTLCSAEVRKNRVTGKIGKDWSVEFPIYVGLGIDDVGANVDFLLSEGYFPKAKEPKGSYDAKELLCVGTRDEIIAHVEAEELEPKLREITGALWTRLVEQCTPNNRKRRYE